jgi:diamine N-acetyltransferase
MTRVTEPDFVLRGERAALGVMRREHLPALGRWFNDPEVRHRLAHRGIGTAEDQDRWFEAVTEAGRARRPSEATFVVHDARDGEPVGVCSLEEIDHHFGRAELGIYLGERRGQGIGSDAIRLLLDWAFNMLDLRNVMLETFAFNEEATRAYERAGFREIGRRRDALVSLGRRYDAILMDATAAGFESPVLAVLRPAT